MRGRVNGNMNDAGPDGEPQSQLEKYVRTIIRYVGDDIDRCRTAEHRANSGGKTIRTS